MSNRRFTGSAASWLVIGLVVVALAVLMLARGPLGRHAQVVGPASSGGAGAVLTGSESATQTVAPISTTVGYPAPEGTATATPAPTAGRFPPPEGIAYQVTSLSAPPYSDLLAGLQSTLSSRPEDVAAMVPPGTDSLWIVPLLGQLGRDQGAQIGPEEARQLLAQLGQAGSTPLVQGYFAVTTTEKGDPAPAPTLWVVTTGWSGQVAFPTVDPQRQNPENPQLTPEYIATDAAVWRFSRRDAGTWSWDQWRTSDNYYGLVNQVSRSPDFQLGTYYVIR
jgi:hypothetical protein